MFIPIHPAPLRGDRAPAHAPSAHPRLKGNWMTCPDRTLLKNATAGRRRLDKEERLPACAAETLQRAQSPSASPHRGRNGLKTAQMFTDALEDLVESNGVPVIKRS